MSWFYFLIKHYGNQTESEKRYISNWCSGK